MLRHLAHQMPGDQHILMDLGPDGVGGDGPVAQAGHQHQPVSGDPRHQPGQLLGQRLDGPLEDALLPAGQPLQGEGDVAAPGLAQGPLPLLIQHPDRVHREPLPKAVPGLHPGQGGEPTRLLLPELPGLQGQIGPPYPHGSALLMQYVVE